MNNIAASAGSALAASESPRLAALAALLIGFAVVFAAGFASPAAIHNATHDTRHAFGLPCH